MGRKVLLGILGVVVGVVVGGALNMALLQLPMGLYGPEGGIDHRTDPEGFQAYVASLPAVGFLFVLLAHQSQAFVGALLGTLVAGRRSLTVAWILGALTLVGCIGTLLLLPSPAWFAALDVLLPLPLAWLGGRLVLKRDEG